MESNFTSKDIMGIPDMEILRQLQEANRKMNEPDKLEGEFQKRYFTPSIEDIHVGYECEVLHENHSMAASNSIYRCEWRPATLTATDIYNLREHPDRIRVPYLSKEQVEREGWTYQGAKSYYLLGYSVDQGFHNAFEKGHYIIQGRSLFGGHHLKIFFDGDQEGATCVYEGECKDINTFRYICKLLGI